MEPRAKPLAPPTDSVPAMYEAPSSWYVAPLIKELVVFQP